VWGSELVVSGRNWSQRVVTWANRRDAMGAEIGNRMNAPASTYQWPSTNSEVSSLVERRGGNGEGRGGCVGLRVQVCVWAGLLQQEATELPDEVEMGVSHW